MKMNKSIIKKAIIALSLTITPLWALEKGVEDQTEIKENLLTQIDLESQYYLITDDFDQEISMSNSITPHYLEAVPVVPAIPENLIDDNEGDPQLEVTFVEEKNKRNL